LRVFLVGRGGAKASLGGNVALAAATAVLVLAVLEGAARWTRASQGGGREDNPLPLYTEPDPLLGWRKRPGARATYRRREYTVEVTVNREGMRDPERREPPAPGTFRILALGDSFVEGYSVSLDSTLTQVLERDLARPGCPVEVLNGGTSGYSTDQEYLFYRDAAWRFAPRVVALFFYYNDVLFNDRDNYFGRPKPRLEPAEDGLRVANLPVPAPTPRPPAPPPPADTAPRSALFEWAQGRLMRGAPGAYDALARVGLWPRLGGDPVGEEMRVYRKGPTPRIDGAWSRTALVLEALRRETKKRGASLVLIHVPNRFEVRDRDWALTRRAYDMDEEHWDRVRVRQRLSAVGGRLGIPVLDLTPALRAAEHGMLGGPYYIYDPHWNALGHRAAARALESFLREQGWLPPCATSSGARDCCAPPLRGAAPGVEVGSVLARVRDVLGQPRQPFQRIHGLEVSAEGQPAYSGRLVRRWR
jgi:lysophospholipase L1-like esterase